MRRRWISAFAALSLLVAPAAAQRIGVGIGVGVGGSGGGSATPALSSISGTATVDAPIGTVVATPSSTLTGCTWAIASQTNFAQASSTGIVTKAASTVTAGSYTPATTCTRIANSQTISLSGPLALTITGGSAGLAEAFIASNQLMAVATQAAPTGKLRYLSHTRHYIASNTAAKTLHVGLMNWSFAKSAGTAIERSWGSYPVDTVKVAYNGTVVDMLAGAGSMTVDGAQAVSFAPLIAAASAFGVSEVPAGGVIDVWVEGTVPSGTAVACGAQVASTANNTPPVGGAFYFYDPANAVAQNYTGSTTSAPAGASSGCNGTSYGLALLITGEQSSKTARAGYMYGDSIFAFGLGSASAGWDTTTRIGALIAAASDTNVSHYVASPTRRKALMVYANRLVAEAGTNDLRDGRTAAQLKADNEVLFADFRAQSSAGKIVRTLILPRIADPAVTQLTASGTTITGKVASTAGLVSGNSYRIRNATDSAYNVSAAGGTPFTIVDGTTFTYQVATAPTNASSAVTTSTIVTDNNTGRTIQRPIPGFGVGEARDVFNGIVQDWSTATTIDAIADVVTPSAHSDDTHLWYTDTQSSGIGTGTANLRSVDGVHESGANRDLTKVVIRNALANTGGN